MRVEILVRYLHLDCRLLQGTGQERFSRVVLAGKAIDFDGEILGLTCLGQLTNNVVESGPEGFRTSGVFGTSSINKDIFLVVLVFALFVVNGKLSPERRGYHQGSVIGHGLVKANGIGEVLDLDFITGREFLRGVDDFSRISFHCSVLLSKLGVVRFSGGGLVSFGHDFSMSKKVSFGHAVQGFQFVNANNVDSMDIGFGGFELFGRSFENFRVFLELTGEGERTIAGFTGFNVKTENVSYSGADGAGNHARFCHGFSLLYKSIIWEGVPPCNPTMCVLYCRVRGNHT